MNIYSLLLSNRQTQVLPNYCNNVLHSKESSLRSCIYCHVPLTSFSLEQFLLDKYDLTLWKIIGQLYCRMSLKLGLSNQVSSWLDSDYAFGEGRVSRDIIEVTLCSQCIPSGSTWFWFNLLLVILPLSTWWYLPGSPP